jgi:type I restriction enzyme S subunit
MVVKKGYKQTEVGVIPEDWALGVLQELVQEGRSIRYGIVQPGNYDPHGRFMIRGQDYSKGWVNPIDLFRVSASIEQRYQNARVKTGDVIITIVGASTGTVAVVPQWLDDANITQTTARVAINSSRTCSNFCKHVLASWCGQVQVRNYIKGGAQPGLNCGDIAKFKIPLPPTLAEQEAIASALSDADAWIESLEQLIAKKRQIKQGAMQELLTGKRRLPGFEVKRGYKQTEFGVIPNDWNTIRLTLLADVRDGTHESPRYVKDGVPFVTSKNIVSGRIDFKEITYISEPDAREIDKRSKVNRNDILVSMIGTVGNAAIIDFDPVFCIKNVALIKTDINALHPYYLLQLIRSDDYSSYIESQLAGGIQKFISLSILRSLDVPLPPIFTEQTAIATVLSDMDTEIESLESKLAKAREIKQGMMQELLTGRIRLV